MLEKENILIKRFKELIDTISKKKNNTSHSKRENEKKIKRYELEYITLGICIVVDYIASAISCCNINIYKGKELYYNPLYYKLNYRDRKSVV